MSTFAKATFGAANYKSFRPVYPAQFYEYLKSHFSSKPALAVDVGCGTGQATLALAAVADTVVGIDNSKKMVDHANESDHPKNISFRVGNDQTFAADLAPGSVDLITVAEAAHWFDLPKFYQLVHKTLKKDGILAIWGYCDQEVHNYPQITPIVYKYSYDDAYMGKFWDDGRHRLKEFYANDKIPTDLFSDVEYHFNSGDKLSSDEHLEIRRTMTAGNFIDYFRTYSSYHNWLEAHPDATPEEDIITRMATEIFDATGLTAESEITVKWNTVYMFGRK